MAEPVFGKKRAEPIGQRVRTYVTQPMSQPRRASIAAEHAGNIDLEVASVEDSVQNQYGRPACDPPRWGNSSQPQTRRLLATAWTATTSRRWMAFAWSNHWVRPAFGFTNIQEVIDLLRKQRHCSDVRLPTVRVTLVLTRSGSRQRPLGPRLGWPADDAAAHGVCPVPSTGASCVGVHGLPVVQIKRAV